MGKLQAALPREHYIDAGQFATERDAVLARSWMCVERLSELGVADSSSGALLPNRRAVVSVLDESVLVTTDEDAKLHAFFNVCRHRGSQLFAHDPCLSPTAMTGHDAKVVRCPYHSWTYTNDGRLLRAPHTEDVDDFDPGEFGLSRVDAGVWAGFLWVKLDNTAEQTLADELGPVTDRVRRYPLAELAVGARITYDVASNWKVLAENYNECYHCGPVHPELCRLVPAFAQGGADLDWENGIPHRADAWTFTASGTTHRAPFPDLDEHERVRHKGELVYPNLLLSLSADHVASFVLHPLAADRTRIVFDVLVSPDEAAGDCSDASDFWDLVNRQDWGICESVQRGMSSRGYREGWFAPMEDSSLDIRRWLLPRLEAGANKRQEHA